MPTIEEIALVIANTGRTRNRREEQPWKFFTEGEQATAIYFATAIHTAFKDRK